MYHVSVIIPVFKVEQFIVRCAKCLLEQSLENIQLIFVDDCSPDNSIALLEKTLQEHPACTKEVQILHHEHNKGLAAARNTGLAVATGEYVLHCDSDDYLELDALEQFYTKAKAADADIVWSDWYLTFATAERYMSQPQYATAQEALQGVLGGGMKFNVWNKLVRRSLYVQHQIAFPEGHNMGEDMTMIMLFAVAQRVASFPKALYHYVRLNENAYTQQQTPQQLADILFNANRVTDFLQHHSTLQITSADISIFQLNVKFPFLATGKREDYHRWQTWFPEANSYICKNHSMGVRARFLQWCASKNLFFIVKCHALFLSYYYKRYSTR